MKGAPRVRGGEQSQRTRPVGLVRGWRAQEPGLKPHPGTDTGVNDSQAFFVSKSHCDSNSRKGIPTGQLGALAHLTAVGSGATVQWMPHHPNTTVCSCFLRNQKLTLRQHSWVQYSTNFSLKVQAMLCLLSTFGSFGDFYHVNLFDVGACEEEGQQRILIALQLSSF